MRPLRLATAWLSGCSGCHMSLLNLHEQLIHVISSCELVYSPLCDIKEFPANVDITLVEGAVANSDNHEMALVIRERSAMVVSMGDCAVNGNVSALRNPLGKNFFTPAGYGAGSANERIVMLPQVLPLHQVIPVDAFLPGCPPESSQMLAVLNALSCTR